MPAQEADIRWPVALTCAIWERCGSVPPGALCQDEAGRLWDVLWLLACAIRRFGNGAEVRFPRLPAAPDGRAISCRARCRRLLPQRRGGRRGLGPLSPWTRACWRCWPTPAAAACPWCRACRWRPRAGRRPAAVRPQSRRPIRAAAEVAEAV